MKILVVRNDKLGDFITALPSLYIIKQHLPQAHLAVLIAPLNESVALSCEFIDEVIIDEGQSARELASFLKPKAFDLSITLFSNTRVAIAQFLARIPKRIAPATKIAQIFYNKRVRQRRSEVKMAEFEYNMALVQSEFPDINMQYPKQLLKFSRQELKEAFDLFQSKTNLTKDIIAFHTGFGGSSDANWNVEEYIKLAQSIQHHDTIDIVFTFGPGDEKFLEEFEAKKGSLKAVVYKSEGSVADFAKLITSFKLFVSTSTGTFHLASAVGTETVTFFADTLFASSKRWKGIGDIALQHNYMIPIADYEKPLIFNHTLDILEMIVSKTESETIESKDENES
jgi:ADP-heptose:LPS heptosyltransferase